MKLIFLIILTLIISGIISCEKIEMLEQTPAWLLEECVNCTAKASFSIAEFKPECEGPEEQEQDEYNDRNRAYSNRSEDDYEEVDIEPTEEALAHDEERELQIEKEGKAPRDLNLCDRSVRICHIPEGNIKNAHILIVGIDALKGHIIGNGDCVLEAGDQLSGKCSCE